MTLQERSARQRTLLLNNYNHQGKTEGLISRLKIEGEQTAVSGSHLDPDSNKPTTKKLWTIRKI